jgi:hypothetical protein
MISPESGGSPEPYNSRELNDLALALFNSSGVQQLGTTADVNGVGLSEAIVRELAPGTYYARVSGSKNDVQLYQISISGAAPGVDDLVWIGGLSDGAWDVLTTQNFFNGDDADVFRPADRVLFNDSAATTTVIVAENVAPGAMTIDATRNYSFVGVAGIATPQLTVAGGGVVALSTPGNALGGVDVQSGTLTISGPGNAPLAGTIHVADGAVLQLLGAQPLAANVRISGGGAIAGDLAVAGMLAPGDSAGTLNVSGNVTLAESSVVDIELGGLIAGSQHDLLDIDGGLALDGTLHVSLIDGFRPDSGDLFTVLTANQLVGVFNLLALPTLHSGLFWQSSYAENALTLSVGGAANYDAADFNEDLVVDGNDLTVWQQGFGLEGAATHEQGDADGDQTVDGADLLVWQRRLSVGDLVAMSSREVPEPLSLAIVFAAAVAIGSARRRGHC